MCKRETATSAGDDDKPAAPSRRRRRRRRVVVFGLLVMVGLLVAFLVTGSDAGPAYRFAHADLGPVEKVVRAVGRIEARDSVDVGAEISGTISAVHVDFGARVKAGDPLAEIDRAPFAADAARAKAALDAARAELRRKDGRVTLAELALKDAKRKAARARALAAGGHISAQALDEAVTALERAQAEHAIALAEREAQAARITGLKAALRNSRRLLDKTVIRAPIDGVVIDRRVAPGQTIVSAFQAQTLFTIAADLAQLRLVVDVTEADIGAVTPGQQVRFSVDAWPKHRFTGVVARIRPAAQVKEGLVIYPVLVDVDNADGRLLPGMTADVQIVVERVNRALRVPLAALAWRPSAETGSGGLLPKVSIQIVSRQEAERLKQRGHASLTRTEGAIETGGTATVHILFASDSIPTPVPVKLGLVGERYAEIREGDVKPGDAVVVGVKETGDGGNA